MHENLMVALSGYFDDSCSDAGNQLLVVAGFIAEAEQWERFNEEWEGILADFHIPYFRAKEFDDGRRGYGRYENWSDYRRNEFLQRLLGVIVRRTNKSFGTTLDKHAYAAIIEPDPILKIYFGTPYAFCAFTCTHQATDWRDEMHPNTPILFVFDEGHKNAGQLKRSAEELKASDRMIIDLTTDDDRKLLPLQAADLLAFELCADVRRQATKAKRYTRYALLRLDEHPREWISIDKNTLRTLIPQLRSKNILPPEVIY